MAASAYFANSVNSVGKDKMFAAGGYVGIGIIIRLHMGSQTVTAILVLISYFLSLLNFN